MIDNEDNISLRPLSLRPGGAGNPFAQFSKGAGFDIRRKVKDDPWEDKPARKPEERIRYSRKFLEGLREGNTGLPDNVPTYLPCFTAGERSVFMFNRTFQQASTSDSVDDRDWTARKAQFPTPPPNMGGRAGGQPVSKQQYAKVSTLNKASEQGREAYRPIGAQSTSSRSTDEEAKTVRTIKGILNKLTPDNFERLQSQLVALVATAEILRQTISLVFEMAVNQPTFCALYAQLGEKLAAQLSDFPPAEGEDKPMTFRRILLNTCQDEFEGTSEFRERLAAASESEREAQERALKNRTLGNVRLISELYKKGLVMEKIMHACLGELLKTENDAETPAEDNLEATCEVLTLAGKKLAASQRFAKHLPAYMVRLERYSNSPTLSSRIRFMIRDILDMKNNNWQPRRERFTAKKIDEIRTEAQKDLGVTIRLPQTRPQSQARPAVVTPADDSELFPAPQKYADDDWKAVTRKFNRGAAAAAAPAVAGPAAMSPPASAKPLQSADKAQARPAPSKKFTPEERVKKAKSMYSEYLSAADKSEALRCASEIATPEGIVSLLEVGINQMLESVPERDQKMLARLMVDMCKEGVYAADELLSGLKATTDQLDDLSLDIPKAPAMCGDLLGYALAQNVWDVDVLPTLCKGIASAEFRRPLSSAALQGVAVATSTDDLKLRCMAKGLKASSFLEPLADYDPPGMPSVEDFLKASNLSMVPL
eukprot:evm.model.scf_2371.1 EVM.evm.TU.scf_2371.1   scf_2371:1164-13593(+)